MAAGARGCGELQKEESAYAAGQAGAAMLLWQTQYLLISAPDYVVQMIYRYPRSTSLILPMHPRPHGYSARHDRQGSARMVLVHAQDGVEPCTSAKSGAASPFCCLARRDWY